MNDMVHAVKQQAADMTIEPKKVCILADKTPLSEDDALHKRANVK